MPKTRKRPTKFPKKNKISTVRRTYLQNTKKPIFRDKENNESEKLVSDHDPLLSFMKIEVDEEIDQKPILDLSGGIKIPIKLETFDPDDEFNNIKQEHEEFSYGGLATLAGNNNLDLNILIEWALNLQFDHSKECKGRLFPCKEIFENFRCKIVVLYCTVCKKRMLHTLKDWAMLQ